MTVTISSLISQSTKKHRMDFTTLAPEQKSQLSKKNQIPRCFNSQEDYEDFLPLVALFIATCNIDSNNVKNQADLTKNQSSKLIDGFLGIIEMETFFIESNKYLQKMHSKVNLTALFKQCHYVLSTTQFDFKKDPSIEDRFFNINLKSERRLARNLLRFKKLLIKNINRKINENNQN